MYILITEDNKIYKSETITDFEKEACDDGYLAIINADDMTEYYQDGWKNLLSWKV